jgi:lysophospholipase L1-like esterase
VKPEDLEQLTLQIETAHRLAETGAPESAVNQFAAARSFACMKVDQTKLNIEVARQVKAYRAEADYYRKEIAALSTRKDASPVIIIGDSLGLPRPTAKDTPRKGAEIIYANLLTAALDGRRVEAICQRFFTTTDAIVLLQREPELGRDADVVLHLGLNDAARRMFLERQRIAVTQLPEDVQKRMVTFAQKYRAQILRFLPPLHYTPPEKFAANLDFIARTLKARKARRIVFSTIIVPPLKFWNATPNLEAFFAKYNHIIMMTALQNAILLLDFDRHIWARLSENPLDSDGMHLSAVGHALMSSELERMLK